VQERESVVYLECVVHEGTPCANHLGSLPAATLPKLLVELKIEVRCPVHTVSVVGVGDDGKELVLRELDRERRFGIWELHGLDLTVASDATGKGHEGTDALTLAELVPAAASGDNIFPSGGGQDTDGGLDIRLHAARCAC